VDKKLKRPSTAIHQRTADRVQTSYQYPIIPPRILARADEVIEQAHCHVGLSQILLQKSKIERHRGADAKVRGR
jgi:hypothetical protein